MEKILIVDDDHLLREELAFFLEKNGFACEILDENLYSVKNILDREADLLLLDINLPDADGQFLCQEIRKHSDIPIIMITCKNNEVDELISLSNGADQYVTKPYNLNILLVKIRGLLKRSKNSTSLHVEKIGDAIVDIPSNSVRRGSKEVELTRNEFEILYYLIQNRGTIVSRNELIGRLWDNEAFVDDNTLTVNVQRLRLKLSELSMDGVIETKRGRGYMIR